VDRGVDRGGMDLAAPLLRLSARRASVRVDRSARRNSVRVAPAAPVVRVVPASRRRPVHRRRRRTHRVLRVRSTPFLAFRVCGVARDYQPGAPLRIRADAFLHWKSCRSVQDPAAGVPDLGEVSPVDEEIANDRALHDH
jgi:hypothetical protein